VVPVRSSEPGTEKKAKEVVKNGPEDCRTEGKTS